METKYNNYRHEKENEYAKPYFLLQKYKKLYSINEAFCTGTIFMELNMPYKCKSIYKGVKR